MNVITYNLYLYFAICGAVLLLLIIVGIVFYSRNKS
jgi:hypothetical protein